MIKQLRMNEDFARPLGPAIPKPAPAAPRHVQIKPGIWQAPDGKLETRDPTPFPVLKIAQLPPTAGEMLKAVADAYRQRQEMCGITGAALVGFKREEPTPLPATPNALGDGWIDCSPGMPDMRAGTYEMRNVESTYRWTPEYSLLATVNSEFRDRRYQYRLIP
jgi:hypothetical protein